MARMRLTSLRLSTSGTFTGSFRRKTSAARSCRRRVTRNRNFTPVMVWLRVQMLVPVSIRCSCKCFTSSGETVSRDRPSQEANRLQARRRLVGDAGPRLRAGLSAIMRARRDAAGAGGCLVMAKPSVNRGKITSANSTHPTSKTAKHIPVQRNARHTEPLSRSDLVLARFASAAKSREGGKLTIAANASLSDRMPEADIQALPKSGVALRYKKAGSSPTCLSPNTAKRENSDVGVRSHLASREGTSIVPTIPKGQEFKPLPQFGQLIGQVFVRKQRPCQQACNTGAARQAQVAKDRYHRREFS